VAEASIKYNFRMASKTKNKKQKQKQKQKRSIVYKDNDENVNT
jgi:hypothetical protein